VEINRLTIWAKDRNGYYSNAFKSHTIANTTAVAIVTICNGREVTHSASGMICAASINNLIINKWYISGGG
jgi:hypothetical protein